MIFKRAVSLSRNFQSVVVHEAFWKEIIFRLLANLHWIVWYMFHVEIEFHWLIYEILRSGFIQYLFERAECLYILFKRFIWLKYLPQGPVDVTKHLHSQPGHIGPLPLYVHHPLHPLWHPKALAPSLQHKYGEYFLLLYEWFIFFYSRIFCAKPKV